MRLKKWVKIVLDLIFIILLLILIIKIKIEDKKALNNCLNNGYSYNYCIKNL
jgi:hypothetical protein